MGIPSNQISANEKYEKNRKPNLDSSTKIKAEIIRQERSALMTFGVAPLSSPRFPSSRVEIFGSLASIFKEF
ncbi:unnamed protein product [Rhizophagus irregularis]|nr:unnamed protein product [Rhizophagus irregularis]